MKTTDVSKQVNNVPNLLILGRGYLVLFQKKKNPEGSSTQNYELDKEHNNKKKLVITY